MLEAVGESAELCRWHRAAEMRASEPFLGITSLGRGCAQQGRRQGDTWLRSEP